MKKSCILLPLFLLLITLSNCRQHRQFLNESPILEVSRDTSTYMDPVRKRRIPIATYYPVWKQEPRVVSLVILSHGYGQNNPESYLNYSYITDFLASKGYCVISIQHELPTDSLLPLTGNPQVVRRPFWERGAENIAYVLNETIMRSRYVRYKEIILIGHSNGGDLSALYVQEHTDIVDKLITLDNRRMPLPRTKHPLVLSLRSSDQAADEGVLPSADEQKKFGMRIITLPNTIHNDMDNNATTAQRDEINRYIYQFLNSKR